MENWKFKEYVKRILKCEIWCLALFGVLVLIEYITGFDDTFTRKENILLEIYGLLGVGLIFILPIAIFQLFTKIFKKKHEIHSKDFFRDIDDKYTPAMASFLVDNEVEESKDILATILDLKNRNYLDITDNLDIIIKNKNTDKLYLHEKYIIDTLNIENLISLSEFNNFVKKDCINEKLVKEKNLDKLSKFLFIFLITEVCISLLISFTLSIITWVKKSNDFLNIYNTVIKLMRVICTASFIIVIAILVAIKNHDWTKKGKEVAIKFKGFKNYLKEYTLVKTRDVDYINILDRYLTFALALGEANTIEKLYVPYNKLISKYIEGGNYGRTNS